MIKYIYKKNNINTIKNKNKKFKMSNNDYFSLQEYNKERNEDFLLNSSESDIDNIDPINEEDNSLNQILHFNAINQVSNPYVYEQQIEERFQKNFLLKQDEKDSSLLSHKRINEPIFEEDKDQEIFAEKIKLIPEPIKIEQKDTKESTGAPNKIKKIIKKQFEVNQKVYRNDYFIKKLKVNCFSNFATDKLNSLLKSCNFPKTLNLSKIYMPNNKAFTSIANLKKNKAFLPIPIRIIFSMQNGEGQYQEKNELNFITIFNSRDEAGNVQAYNNLVEYLNKTVEEVIIDYYNSEEFDEFRANEEIIEYDGAFYKEKKFSLLQDYGFLRLIRGHY